MAEKTIIYITDNSLDKALAKRCQENLVEAASDIPIVCVTQHALSFGNITIGVGKLPKTISSIVRQILIGLDYVDSKWVFIAEHDCLYTKEHFQFTPDDNSYFWYNGNIWFVQHLNPKFPELDGMYSKKSHVQFQSQLMSDTNMMRVAQQERLDIIEDSTWKKHHPSGRLGEPGAASYKKAMKLSKHFAFEHLKPKLTHYCTYWKSKYFRTDLPNIDIRHGGNFTGPFRGSHRTFDLEHWGKWDSVFSQRRLGWEKSVELR